MSPIFTTLIVMLAAVFAVAIWMDVRRRHLGDTKAGGAMSRATRQTRLHGREKSSESGAGL